MKKIIIISISIIFCFYNSNAETDKYRLSYNDNPSTTISIGWVQNGEEMAELYFGTEDFGVDYKKYLNKRTANRTVEYKGAKHCFVNLNNLSPNTIYYFVIKHNNHISKRFSFLTIPDNSNERLSIIAGGDSRTCRDKRQLANKMVAKLQPHFVIFDGDYTMKGSGAEWNKWLDDWQLTTNKDGRMIPVVAVRGNHECNEDVYNIFNVPDKNIYFSLDFGGNLLHTTILNSEIKIAGKQTYWLKKDLKQNKNSIWRTVCYHKPMRPHYSKKKEGQKGYKNWAKPFYANNVQLVIEGDTHVCKTTWAIKPSMEKGNDMGFVRAEKGTVYIGEGTWGAPVRKADDSKEWTRDAAAINQFKWIFIDKDKIEIRTVLYENANEVSELSIDKMFEIPDKINLWKPTNGEVVFIEN